MKYLTFDYEEDATRPHWHIYTLDAEPETVTFGEEGASTWLTIEAPNTPEMFQAIKAICDSVEHAIDLAAEITPS